MVHDIKTDDMILGKLLIPGVNEIADGQYQTGVVRGNYIFRSTDYGQTWTQVGSSASWYSVAVNQKI